MSKCRKKTGRILLIAYVVIFCLPAAVFALLRTPFVQQFIAREVAAYFSKELNTKVSIGRIDVIFPIDITLYDVYIEDLHQNPMLKAKRLMVAPENLSLDFTDMAFDKLQLQDAEINMLKYKGEKKINFDFLISYFSGSTEKKPKKEKKSAAFSVNAVELLNCTFRYRDQNKDDQVYDYLNFNNLAISHINLVAQNISFNEKGSSADLSYFCFSEQSGFNVIKFSSHVEFSQKLIRAKNLILKSNSSQINFDLALRYDSLQDFNDFVNKVKLEADFRQSFIGFSDIARFAPALQGMQSRIVLTGKVGGTIADLTAKDIQMQIGQKSILNFDLQLRGLPDIKKTRIQFDLTSADILVADLDAFTLPGGKTLHLTPSLGTISRAGIKAQVEGTINDFSVDIMAATNAGSIKASVASKGEFPNPSYHGNIKVQQFDLKPFAGSAAMLGPVTAIVNFSGSGVSADNYRVEGEADVATLEFNRYTYSGINITGKTHPGAFEGRLLANDPNLALDFDGIINFSESLPVFDFIAQVENVNLSALHLARNDSASGFSGLLDINIKGNKPDNMLGKVSLTNFSYYEGRQEISMNSMQLKLEQVDTLNKKIELKSDLVNGTIKGVFVFDEIGQAFQSYLSSYVPSYYVPDSLQKELDNQSFEFDFVLKDAQPILNVFVDGLEISKGAIARGRFDLKEKYFKAEVASNNLTKGSVKMSNLMTLAETFNNTIYITAQCDQLRFNDSLEIGNLLVNTVTMNDQSSFTVNWSNQKAKKMFAGDLSGEMIFRKGKPVTVAFDQSDITLNDSLFHIADKGKIEFASDYIRIQDFSMFSQAQKLMVDGRISKDPYDVVQVSFENVLLDDFDELTRSAKLNLDGNVNGYLLLSNLYDLPDYRADIQVNKFYVNKNYVGDANISSRWDPVHQSVYSEASIKFTGNVGSNIPLKVHGFFNPRDSVNTFDLAINFDRFQLKLVEPYIKSFSSQIYDGTCSGEVTLKGNVDKPDVSGYLSFKRLSVLIDYLNMYYSITDTVKINNSEISIRDAIVFDTKGNMAKGDLVVTHDYFRNFKLDISLKPQKMQFLNTSAKDNDYFYGTAFASGVVKIYGPFNQITIEVAAKTDPGSVLCIPITSSSEVYENNFIRFKTKDSVTTTTLPDIKVNDSGLSLTLDIDVTPDAEVQIVFDPKVGDVMTGRGEGRLKMTIDRSGEFLMFGNLEIDKGDYLFTLENVINKKFLVNEGGTITWNGDPYGGKMDLMARYKVSTSLYELLYESDDPEQYKKNVPVNCLMHLTGDLLSPDISFDIDLPQSDENTKNLVRSVIANAEEMNRQVFALLILNSFIPVERNTFNSPISQGLGNTSFELISNQFSNWLSQISRDFDVDFSYNQGDQVTTSEVVIALSTQILNDRIVLETNFEIGGTQVGATNQQASNIAGDVSIEYKISEDGKLRVKAFNRSNTVDVVANNAPYTQGVALFYRKDFDRIKELWLREKKDKKKP